MSPCDVLIIFKVSFCYACLDIHYYCVVLSPWCRERESHHLYTLFPFTCMPHMRMPMTVRIAAFAYMLHIRMRLTVRIAAFFLLDTRACTGLADRLHAF